MEFFVRHQDKIFALIEGGMEARLIDESEAKRIKISTTFDRLNTIEKGLINNVIQGRNKKTYTFGGYTSNSANWTFQVLSNAIDNIELDPIYIDWEAIDG